MTNEFSNFLSIYTEEERKAKIQKEHRRIKKILKTLKGEKQIAVEKLICEAAFLAVTLEETRLIINRDGIIELYQNGANQSGKKKSSAVEVYDKLLNVYIKVVKQLCDSLPDPQEQTPAEEIMAFVTGIQK